MALRFIHLQPRVTAETIVHSNVNGRVCISVVFECTKRPSILWYFKGANRYITGSDERYMINNEIVATPKQDQGHPLWLLGSMLVLLESTEEDEGEYTVYAQTDDGRTEVSFKLLYVCPYTFKVANESVFPLSCYDTHAPKILKNGRAYTASTILENEEEKKKNDEISDRKKSKPSRKWCSKVSEPKVIESKQPITKTVNGLEQLAL